MCFFAERVRAVFVLLALATALGVASSGQSRPSPIVILVSFDGWRWDYFDRASVPHLSALARGGVRARGLIPSFPSSTFPNHYTMVTGLRPERHGIVANSMREPGFADRFTMSSATAKTARWWGGEPIWITAMKQGRKTAAMFWPGSEVEGMQPTHWLPFDDGMPNAARVAKVLEWLTLPENLRPSFVTLYFSDVDDAGHDHGPDSKAVLEAVSRLDALLGQLVDGISKLGLTGRANLVVVSDHGMSALDRSRVVVLDDYIDLSTVDVVEWSPLVAMWPRRGTFDDVYRALAGRHPHLEVYRRASIPAHLHYRNHARIPDVIAIADAGWLVTSRARLLGWRIAGFPGGGHGFDPQERSMHGLFVAAGPQVRNAGLIDAFETVHVYEMLCRLLGVIPAENQGDSAIAGAVVR